MAWIEGRRAQRLAAVTGCPLAEAVGLFVLFMASTQADEIERGSLAMLQSHVLGAGEKSEVVLDGFITLGLLEPAGPDDYDIILNRGLKARRAKAVAKGKHARAFVGQKKPAKRKVTQAAKSEAKTKALASNTITPFQELCRSAWQAYSETYQQTTGQPPIRNAKANALIQQLCKLLGQDTPEVLRFYCRHPSKKYLVAMHPLQMAVYDHQALHTQWRNGHYVMPERADMISKDAAFLHSQAELEQKARALEAEEQHNTFQSSFF